MTEKATSFSCGGVPLVGVLHKPAELHHRGVLFVVGGGPQFRCGAARQLTLWSRKLCEKGYPVFRFDHRGMGDAHGDFSGFEDVDDDIQAAIDHFFLICPELKEVVLWGECDASSAILFYAFRDARIKGLVLLNPWVRTQAGEAKAILRFYYLQRVMQPSFWKKVLSFRFNPFASALSALKLVMASSSPKPAVKQQTAGNELSLALSRDGALPERLLLGLTRFTGSVMLVLSGRDLIAKEFQELITNSDAWQEQLRLKGVTRHDLADADHTFSSAVHRNQVVGLGLDWLRKW